MTQNWYEKYNEEWAFKIMKKSLATGKNYHDFDFEGDLPEQIFQVIALKQNVSFAQLVKIFPEAMEGGEHALCFPDYQNIILWYGMKKEAIDALTWLLNQRLVKSKPTSQLTYLIDGILPDLPIAKDLKQYKTVRWLPVVLDISTPEDNQ